ncbi:MAG: TIGR02117 family protein [Gammaproteobacteria bacterium]|nr:TIGR02117 family protein [Gammaproteobacteria bacterium]
MSCKSFILGFLVVIILGACSSKPFVIPGSKIYKGDGENDIYIISHGWHTGIVIPADDIKTIAPELDQRFGETLYLEFGWGDKGFYQANEITSGLTLRAVFWPTESVMHVVAVPVYPYEYFPDSEIERLCLNNEELKLLIQFLSDSFYKEAGRIVTLKNGLYGDSQFYKAEGDYYLMNTCNKWTAKGLKSIGMDIWPMFKLTSGSIMDYIRKHTQSNGDIAGVFNAVPGSFSTLCPVIKK